MHRAHKALRPVRLSIRQSVRHVCIGFTHNEKAAETSHLVAIRHVQIAYR